MSDTTQTVNDTTTEVVDNSTQQVEQQNTTVPFDIESWENNPVNSSATEQTTQTVTTEKKEDDFDLVDENDFIKSKLGFDSLEDAKAAIEEFNKLKLENKQTEPTFSNDQSKKFYDYVKDGKENELFDFLTQKKKIETLLSSEVNDSNAADIIKFGMQDKYKELSNDEIEHKFNKQYSIPKEPIQGIDELDSEFDERKQNWESEIALIKKEMVIDAKLIKPELDKLKQDLVLPEISTNSNQQKEPTQDELDAQKKYVENYLNQVSETLKGINDLSITVKDEEVEIPISYTLSDDEKQNVATKLKEFAENNFDANALFSKRWLNEDKSLNIKQIAKDFIKLETDEKVSQKFVNEAAQKRLSAYIKSKSNININETNSGQSATTQNNEVSMSDFFWSV